MFLRSNGYLMIDERQVHELQLRPASLLLMCFLLYGSNLEAERPPYRGVSQGGKHRERGALITTEKRSPNKAERRMVLTESGIPREQWRNYVVEYRVPIELGGSNSFSNIEVLPKSEATLKHRLQKSLKSQLHDRKISESEAQQKILNWRQTSTTTTSKAADR